MPIKRIGGYSGSGVPSPFYISLYDLYVNAPSGSKYGAIFAGDIYAFNIQDAYVVEDVVFTLNIGKNIEAVEFVVMDQYFPHINEDSSVTFYHPVVYINCSEENKDFYSQDGKLLVYWTKSGSVWHESASCSSLANTPIENLVCGSEDEALSAGKERACKKCS